MSEKEPTLDQLRELLRNIGRVRLSLYTLGQTTEPVQAVAFAVEDTADRLEEFIDRSAEAARAAEA
ncbi:MAG: hypothetical protein OXM87_01390 [Truepera sp.]|nr:hypothetical protein [Truepera sp.]